VAKDQTSLLEELRDRHHDAQVRFQDAQQAFQIAQAAQAKAQTDFQKAQQTLIAAQNLFHGWSTAYNTVMAEETARKQATEQAQPQLPLPNAPSAQPVDPPPAEPETIQTGEQKSKTELIRDLLRQSPHGLTPTEIWSHVRGQFKYRAYLYSVLKRLTDREELSVRRGKYAIRMIPQQEVKEVAATIQ
jgi:uncharacterized protein YdiU (UPF0061 family)